MGKRDIEYNDIREKVHTHILKAAKRYGSEGSYAISRAKEKESDVRKSIREWQYQVSGSWRQEKNVNREAGRGLKRGESRTALLV